MEKAIMKDLSCIPDPPEFSKEQIKACKESRDFRPMLFEWYRFAALLCNYFARIHPYSPMLRKIPGIQYSVCVGLLNRCSRLMLSNLTLSQNGKFGETTAIIDRSIFESCVILAWLCHKNDTESFERYLAEGLKTELEFKSAIEKEIEKRGGQALVIENRMLASIKRQIKFSTLSESQIRNAKRLPDIASMINTIGQPRLVYIGGQKIGSHHVHGTFSSLQLHYLEMTPEGFWTPSDNDCSTHKNQFTFVSIEVLNAMKSFIGFCVADQEDRLPFIELIDSIIKDIQNLKEEADENDFDIISEN